MQTALPSRYSRACGLTVFILGLQFLSSWASAAALSDLELAQLSALDGPELEQAYESETGERKLLTGLVLADFYSDYAPMQVEEHLAGLPRLVDSTDPFVQTYRDAVLCVAKARQAMLDEAKPACERAKSELANIQSKFLESRVLSSQTFLALLRSDVDEALRLSLYRENLVAELGHPFLIARSYHNTAVVFTFGDLSAQALERYERAHVYLEITESHPLKRVISFNLGVAALRVGDYPRALERFKEGLKWAEATGQAHRALVAKVAMATALNSMGQPEESLSVLEEPLSAGLDQHNVDALLNAYFVAGRAYFLMQKFDLAMECFQHGVTLALRESNLPRWHQLEKARVETMEAIGDIELALEPASALVASLRDFEHRENFVATLQLYARLQHANGDHEGAYRSLAEADEGAQDSAEIRDHRKLAVLEAANELERVEREKLVAQAAQRELRISAERNQLIGWGGMLLAFVALAFVLFDLQRRRQRRQVLEHQETSALLEQQVEARTRELEENMVQRMKVEEERRDLEQELAESEKMRSLGQLTGGVAHDFNNLLTVVTGAAELLEQYPEMEAVERNELIKAILEAARSGSDINAGLLAYARRQQLNPEPIALMEFFGRARLIFQQTLGQGMSLEMNVAPVTILADHGQLMTAVLNLLTNAREASNGRGKVEISVLRSSQHGGQEAVIVIRDSGRGMSEQETARAVEPFYSTKEGSMASGLGLSRVYGFVQQSGGHIRIDSTVDEGTTIRMSFPIYTDHIPEKAPVREQPISARRVMLVDDNADVRLLVEKMLDNLGHEVTTASSGDEAIARLPMERADILITDVLMPGEFSGIELARAVRERHPHLPILMISGFAEAPDLDFPLLSKPFSISELKAAIQNL